MHALVTGGCKGLGKSFTLELVKRGYEVTALYQTSEEEARDLSKNEQINCVKCDVANEEEVKRLCASLKDVDLLINNASLAKDGDYKEKSLEEFMSVMRVNVGGVFTVMKHVIPKMKVGVILNISSNNTLGYHQPLSMDYDASKAGVNILTKDFAEVLKETKIKVFAIAPGWIATESVMEANPKYIEEELKRANQKKLLEPDILVRFILDHLGSIQNGEIREIKEIKR